MPLVTACFNCGAEVSDGQRYFSVLDPSHPVGPPDQPVNYPAAHVVCPGDRGCLCEWCGAPTRGSEPTGLPPVTHPGDCTEQWQQWQEPAPVPEAADEPPTEVAAPPG